MQTVLSIDIGTTALKAAYINPECKIKGAVSKSYCMISKGDLHEQAPEDWWSAFKECTALLAAEYPHIKPAAVVLSGQMQDLICIKNGKQSGNAILYSDTRASAEWIEIENKIGLDAYSIKTRNSGGPGLVSSKLLWVKKQISEADFKSTVFLLGAHDYIFWKLTGKSATDYTNASTTGLLNFDENDWDPDILQLIGIRYAQLPQLIRSDEVTGVINGESEAETGLPEGLPVIHGAGDAASSTVGAGAGINGSISCYLGTSGWVAATSARFVNPKTGIFNLKHPNPEQVLNIGPMILTGGNVDWAVRNLFMHKTEGPDGAPTAEDFSVLTAAAAEVLPGSNGLLFLPYLSGERSPFTDMNARGAFIGLDRSTGAGEMARAVFEGVSYSLKSIAEVMIAAGTVNNKVLLTGGGALNSLWPQIIASVLNSNIEVIADARDSSHLGNMVLAARALGWRDSFEVPEEVVKVDRKYRPIEEQVVFYKSGYKIFEKLYPALRSTFGEIASLKHSNQKLP